MCLHGTSSVKPENLPQVPRDGFVKVNIYTTRAVHGGQAVAREILNSLRGIFSEPQLKQLIQEGALAQSVLSSPGSTSIKPKLASVANPPRRDAWFQAVKNRCKDFLEALNYRRYAD
jgi:fructose/tagatose bisphosphate aldolase